MNFLAHLFLADDNEDALLGNLLGDFVKGDPAGRFRDGVTEGILLHRKVDTFADSHAITRKSRQRFSSDRRRFAGVIVDMCYDHFLAVHWQRYAGVPLDRFAGKVYGILKANRSWLPQRLKRIMWLMESENWLCGYAHISRLGTTLDRIAGRLSRGQQFKGAIEEVEANYQALESDFSAFFPELITFAAHQKSMAAVSENADKECP